MAYNLVVKSITRINSLKESETIELTEGVNSIVGLPNSGKTVWLMMLDFLLGDAGSVEDALSRVDRDGKPLYDIYVELIAVIEINNIEYLIERKWKESGLKSKIIIDSVPYDASEFSKFILGKLDIPTLKFSKGNPYQDGAWIELTFRILFRHVYRQERFWGDLADKQPESEQHAALCQFLGLSEKLFSPLSNELIESRKELSRLQIQKDQFQEVLDQITKRILPAGERGITFVTADALKERIHDLERQLEELANQREKVIERGINDTLKKEESNYDVEIKLSENRALLVAELESNIDTQKKNANQYNRFEDLLKNVDNERNKLVRTKTAGNLLADIKITHCPACDQEVIDKQDEDESICFLCHQHLNPVDSEKRVDFEIYQLETESKELKEVIIKLKKEQNDIKNQYELLKENLAYLDQQLKPLKQKFSGLVENQVSSLDLRRGKLTEQIQSYNRIMLTLNYRDDISKKIMDLSNMIRKKSEESPSLNQLIDYEQVADDLTDGMMEYINKISEDRPERWPFADNNNRIRLYLNDKKFNFSVGRTNWWSIGATPQIFFLLSYHYGLLKLVTKKHYNYPGILVIDFPPVLADGALNTSENYLIKPFIDLSRSLNNSIQIIIAGKAFDDLDGINKVTLEGAYT